jgi:hypothetical protein
MWLHAELSDPGKDLVRHFVMEAVMRKGFYNHPKISNQSQEQLIKSVCARVEHALATIRDAPGTDDSPKLKLYVHQIWALAWLIVSEVAPVPTRGGFLLDDMGVGKTVKLTALVLADMAASSKPTLIVVPKSVLPTWCGPQSDLRKAMGDNYDKWVEVVEDNRTISLRLPTARFVITTYTNFQMKRVPKEQRIKRQDTGDADRHPMTDYLPVWLRGDKISHFKRLVLDEAHNLRNCKTMVHRSLVLVHTTSTWIVSGTPLQNRPRDMRNLWDIIARRSKTPFDKDSVLKYFQSRDTIQSIGMHACIGKLDVLKMKVNMTDAGKQVIRALRLLKHDLQARRMAGKEDGERRKHHDDDDDLDGGGGSDGDACRPAKERTAALVELEQKCVREGKDALDLYRTLHLPLTNAIRMAGIDPLMVFSTRWWMYDADGNARCDNDPPWRRHEVTYCSISAAPRGKVVCDVTKAFFYHSLVQTLTKYYGLPDRAAVLEQGVAREEHLGDKPVYMGHSMRAVFRSIMSHDAKCLVFMHFTEAINQLLVYLRMAFRVQSKTTNARERTVSRFDGRISSNEDRNNIVEAFNNDEASRVIIIQLTCGGAGLNLQAAEYVYFLSPDYNPCNDMQALARAYRAGNSKAVKCITYRPSNGEDEDRDVGAEEHHIGSIRDEKFKLIIDHMPLRGITSDILDRVQECKLDVDMTKGCAMAGEAPYALDQSDVEDEERDTTYNEHEVWDDDLT